MVWAIVPAAGRGVRSGAPKNKVLMSLCGVPVLVHTLRALRDGGVDAVALCGAEAELQDLDALCAAYGLSWVRKILPGGPTRSETVRLALEALETEQLGAVLVHDAARPLASPALIRTCVAAAQSGPFAAAVPVRDTVKQARDGFVTATPDRSALWAAQTPQGGPYRTLLDAYRLAKRDGFWAHATDDASICEHAGLQVRLLPGEENNLKITAPSDFSAAQGLMWGAAQTPALRVGQGFDAHRLTPGRPLVLCGVPIPCEQGLLGHSDADVALHALMDALLGAAALGDIGALFPDTDERYRNVSSLKLLAQVCTLLSQKGYAPENVDVTIIAQRPKLMPYRNEMRAQIALVTGLPLECVSVKATTTEKMGYEGRGEGISAQAVALVRRG